MKEIRYRGGMLVFHLPDSWKEEDHGDGTAYYEGEAEYGSLNVSLTTVQNDAAVNESMVRSVAMTGHRAGESEAERLENGNFVRRFERPPSDDPNPLQVTFWLLANAVPPHTIRYAVFNFGSPPSVVGTPRHRECLAMLDEEIRRTAFTTLTPEEVVALQKAARPWWKFW